MNIQDKINDYVNNGGKYSRQEIEDAIKSITPNGYQANTSVFEIEDGEISMEDFRTAISNVAGFDASEEADIIFDLFNSNDDDKLDYGELDTLASRRGAIESFSVWNTFLEVTNGEHDTSTDSTSDTGSTSVTDSSSSTDNDISWQFSDEINEKRKLIEETIGDGTGMYKTPEDVISYLEESGAIDKDMADELRASYSTYSKEDEASIASHLRLMRENNPDATRADAIAELKAKGKISDPINTADTPLSEANVDKQVKVDVDKYVELLHNAMAGGGTDEDMLDNILVNSINNISDADFVAILKAYEQKYGMDAGGKGLVTQIESETSGDLQVRLTRALGLRLTSAAASGIDGAIDLIAKEAYSGTAGQNCTANDFLEAIFADPTQGGLSDSDVAKLAKRYKEIYGHSLQDDIKADYGGIFNWRNWFGWKVSASGEGQHMINRLNLCDE